MKTKNTTGKKIPRSNNSSSSTRSKGSSNPDSETFSDDEAIIDQALKDKERTTAKNERARKNSRP